MQWGWIRVRKQGRADATQTAAWATRAHHACRSAVGGLGRSVFQSPKHTRRRGVYRRFFLLTRHVNLIKQTYRPGLRTPDRFVLRTARVGAVHARTRASTTWESSLPAAADDPRSVCSVASLAADVWLPGSSLRMRRRLRRACDGRRGASFCLAFDERTSCCASHDLAVLHPDDCQPWRAHSQRRASLGHDSHHACALCGLRPLQVLLSLLHEL